MNGMDIPTMAPCPFCAYLRGEAPCAFVTRGKKVSVFLNPRQYERGALLVIPNEHVESLLSATDEQFHAVQAEARRCAQLLVQQLGASGVNVYQNTGRAAGQTVPHYHVHVVPRYAASDPARRFHEADYAITPAAELESLAEQLNEPRRSQEERAMKESAPARRSLIISKLVIALVITVLSLGRCSGAPDEAGEALDPESAAAPDSAASTSGTPTPPEGAPDEVAAADCEALGVRILRLHPTRAALAEAYGPPDSVRATAEPNRHVPGATDSLFAVHYPGLEVHIRTPAGARDLVSDVVVRDGRYIADPRLGPGADAASVRAALGEPGEQADEQWTYECGTHVENPVTFEFRAGRVAAISIGYYVD